MMRALVFVGPLRAWVAAIRVDYYVRVYIYIYKYARAYTADPIIYEVDVIFHAVVFSAFPKNGVYVRKNGWLRPRADRRHFVRAISVRAVDRITRRPRDRRPTTTISGCLSNRIFV